MLKKLTDPIIARVSALLATRRFTCYPHIYLTKVDINPVETTDQRERAEFVAIAFGDKNGVRAPNSPWPSEESLSKLIRVFNGQKPEWKRDFYPQGGPTMYGFAA